LLGLGERLKLGRVGGTLTLGLGRKSRGIRSEFDILKVLATLSRVTGQPGDSERVASCRRAQPFATVAIDQRFIRHLTAL